MTRSTEWCIRLACVVVALWFGWSLVSQTVVALIQQNAQIAALQQQLQAHAAPTLESKKSP